jgi:hypothetical protein
MSTVAYRQNAFNAGELSPRLKGRSDLEKYKTGLQLCENAIPLPHGGVTRRSGFRYINEVKDSTKEVELLPFEFSEDQSYVLEFGDLYMRVYMDGGRVVTVDDETKLLLHMDGPDTSVTFTDDSGAPHTVTPGGNAQIDTAQYKFATASGTFDGNGDYLSIPDHADWNFGSAVFTIDFWVRFNSVTGIHTFWFQDDTHAADYIWFYVDHEQSTLNLRVNDGAGTTVVKIQETWSPVVDTWYHVALIRGWGSVTNDWAFTVDGTLLNAATTSAGTWPDHDQDVTIGGPNDTNMIKDFSPSGWVISKTNDTTLSTTQSKWGDASVYFDGTGDDLNVPDNAMWDILTNANTTIDLWVLHSDHVGTEFYVGQYEGGNDQWYFFHEHGAGLRFYAYENPGTLILDMPQNAAISEITDSAWHHVAFIKVNPDHYGIYLDGTQVSYLYDTSEQTYAGKLEIGGQNAAASGPFQGYMDDVRYTTANSFSADPALPFRDEGNTDHGVATLTSRNLEQALCSLTVLMMI